MTSNNPSSNVQEISISQWFNTDEQLTLEGLRGKPVLIHTFQMLCPGCVMHAIPQIHKVQQVFKNTDLVILGVHTVFEHHQAMEPVSLKAFLHEYKITYPVGVDKPAVSGAIPETMRKLRLQGTPSTLLINRSGKLVTSFFGQVEDIALGALVQSLIDQRSGSIENRNDQESHTCKPEKDEQLMIKTMSQFFPVLAKSQSAHL